MTHTIKENERKIFEAIQRLKDSIFGLTQSFSIFCFEISQDGNEVVSEAKIRNFVDELTLQCKKASSYDERFSDLSPLFFEMSIRYLLAACNPSDWLFQSIKKLASTLYREGEGYKSTFDFMVEEMRKYLDNYWQCDEFERLYSEYSNTIQNFDYDECIRFEKCVKLALEGFIDVHQYNCLVDDFETNKIVTRLDRTASVIQMDLRVSRGVVVDGDR